MYTNNYIHTYIHDAFCIKINILFYNVCYCLNTQTETVPGVSVNNASTSQMQTRKQGININHFTA